MRHLTIAALLIGLATAAASQEPAPEPLPGGGTLRADDQHRLAQIDATTGAALREAFAGADPGDLDQLVAALRGAALPPDQAAAILPGDWSCQMMKLGGGLPLVIYSPFRCTADAEGHFEKLTGSQRTKGLIFPREDLLVYVGTGFIAGDTPAPYADLPEEVDPMATPQQMPEIGVVEMTGPDSGRIIFPQPYLESRMNLLVLRR